MNVKHEPKTADKQRNEVPVSNVPVLINPTNTSKDHIIASFVIMSHKSRIYVISLGRRKGICDTEGDEGQTKTAWCLAAAAEEHHHHQPTNIITWPLSYPKDNSARKNRRNCWSFLFLFTEPVTQVICWGGAIGKHSNRWKKCISSSSSVVKFCCVVMLRYLTICLMTGEKTVLINIWIVPQSLEAFCGGIFRVFWGYSCFQLLHI